MRLPPVRYIVAPTTTFRWKPRAVKPPATLNQSVPFDECQTVSTATLPRLMPPAMMSFPLKAVIEAPIRPPTAGGVATLVHAAPSAVCQSSLAIENASLWPVRHQSSLLKTTSWACIPGLKAASPTVDCVQTEPSADDQTSA